MISFQLTLLKAMKKTSLFVIKQKQLKVIISIKWKKTMNKEIKIILK